MVEHESAPSISTTEPISADGMHGISLPNLTTDYTYGRDAVRAELVRSGPGVAAESGSK